MTIRPVRSADPGLTVVELVLVIGIAGIVMASMAPRFFSLDGFRDRFFHEEVRSALVHGQKLSVASGCPVQVSFTASSFTLLRRTACTSGSYTSPVANPATGQTPFVGDAPPGVTLTSSAPVVRFDPLGRATDAGGTPLDLTVTVGSRSIATIGETGLTYTP